MLSHRYSYSRVEQQGTRFLVKTLIMGRMEKASPTRCMYTFILRTFSRQQGLGLHIARLKVYVFCANFFSQLTGKSRFVILEYI